MGAPTVEAESPESSQAVSGALAEFGPQLAGGEQEGYRVGIPLRGSDRQVVEVLHALERYVAERNAGPAHVRLGGRGYAIRP